jgi:hypothetical protein
MPLGLPKISISTLFTKGKTIIYAEHPGDQLALSLRALGTLVYALESCANEGLASTCNTIEQGIRDAVERIEAKYKADRVHFSEAALHIVCANNVTN